MSRQVVCESWQEVCNDGQVCDVTTMSDSESPAVVSVLSC